MLACLSLLAMTLVGGAPVDAQATTGQHTAYHAAHPLLAYYYAWWEPSKVSGAVFTPVQHYPDWVRQLVDAAYWSDLRGRIDPDHTALWIADGDDFSVLSSDTWDGISPYASAWSPNPDRSCRPGRPRPAPPGGASCTSRPSRPAATIIWSARPVSRIAPAAPTTRPPSTPP